MAQSSRTRADALRTHALALAKQQLGSWPEPTLDLVHAARHALFRATSRGQSIAIQFFLRDVEMLRCETGARSLAGGSIPAPRVLRASDVDADPCFVVLEWSEARSLHAMIAAREGNVARAFEEAGAAVARLAGVPPSRVRRARAILPEAQLASLGFGAEGFARAYFEETQLFRERFAALGTRAQLAIERVQPSSSTRLAIAHGDFQPRNLLFSDDGRLAAVIDWEFARVAPRWSDLAQILRYASTDELEARLASGYARHASLPEGWQSSARCCDLARVALGLAKPGLEGDDVRAWVEYAWGCVEWFESRDPSRARGAAGALLARS